MRNKVSLIRVTPGRWTVHYSTQHALCPADRQYSTYRHLFTAAEGESTPTKTRRNCAVAMLESVLCGTLRRPGVRRMKLTVCMCIYIYICIQGVTGPHRQNDMDDKPCREDHFL